MARTFRTYDDSEDVVFYPAKRREDHAWRKLRREARMESPVKVGR